MKEESDAGLMKKWKYLAPLAIPLMLAAIIATASFCIGRSGWLTFNVAGLSLAISLVLAGSFLWAWKRRGDHAGFHVGLVLALGILLWAPFSNVTDWRSHPCAELRKLSAADASEKIASHLAGSYRCRAYQLRVASDLGLFFAIVLLVAGSRFAFDATKTARKESEAIDPTRVWARFLSRFSVPVGGGLAILYVAQLFLNLYKYNVSLAYHHESVAAALLLTSENKQSLTDTIKALTLPGDGPQIIEVIKARKE